MTKIYGKYFAVLLDNNNKVIWACGNKVWMQTYESHPKLTYDKLNNIWELKREKRKVRKVY